MEIWDTRILIKKNKNMRSRKGRRIKFEGHFKRRILGLRILLDAEGEGIGKTGFQTLGSMVL